jgi:phosphoribosylformylglycinamidine (FGAM) synthase PurS component
MANYILCVTKMKPTQLTTEQQFQLRSFEVQVSKMSREQAQQMLIQMCEQMLIRETMYKQLLKHEWGL